MLWRRKKNLEKLIINAYFSMKETVTAKTIQFQNITLIKSVHYVL